MEDNFNQYSKYYNLLYQDKDYSAEANYVADQLIKHSKNVKCILEFGSGTGSHGLFLKKKGFEIYGLERSEGMVYLAKQNGLDCEIADISSFELDKTFDAVIALFHVVSYLTSNFLLVSAFKNANKHLSKGGIFLFDVWYSPAVYEQRALPRIKRMKNKEISVIRFAEPVIDINSNVIDVKFSVITKDLISKNISEFQESHLMRHFSIPEINLLAEHTGFELLQTEEFLTGKVPSEKTWGVCFILKKIC